MKLAERIEQDLTHGWGYDGRSAMRKKQYAEQKGPWYNYFVCQESWYEELILLDDTLKLIEPAPQEQLEACLRIYDSFNDKGGKKKNLEKTLQEEGKRFLEFVKLLKE